MIFKLNRKFYSIEAVKETLKDFRRVCKGKVLNDKIEIELYLREDTQQLKEEFCNYVLGMMKNKSLV